MALASSVVLIAAIISQPAPELPAPDEAGQLAREILILAQLAPLRLRPEQVAAILKLYQPGGPGAPASDKTLESLVEIKQRLLRGEKVGPMQLRDAFRLASSSGRARRWLTGTTELADGVLAVLNDWQIAILAAGPMRQGAMGQDRRPVGDAAAALLKLKAVPPDQWPQYRKETAERFAGAAGDEEVAPAVSDFLERVRGMSETEMRSKASELAAELQSLVPEGIQALALLAPPDRDAARKRLLLIVSDPAFPRLLREMAAARGWTLAGQ